LYYISFSLFIHIIIMFHKYLRLGELTISCDVLTTDQLSNDALTFYKSQAIRQAYVFLLGLDIIGNPFGLFKDVQRGLYDFFSVWHNTIT